MNKKSLYVILLTIVACIFVIILYNVIINSDNKNYKKVNLTSGKIEQTKEYKLYEFSMDSEDKLIEFNEIVSEVMQGYSDKLDFEYINVTKNMSMTNIYNINSIPTILITNKNGDVKFRLEGIITKNELINWIEKSMRNL